MNSEQETKSCHALQSIVCFVEQEMEAYMVYLIELRIKAGYPFGGVDFENVVKYRQGVAH